MATIDGGPEDDVLDGTAQADLINGLDGNDTLRGRGGADTLVGGLGDDRLIGGSGSDFLQGLDGNDVGNGGRGADTIFGFEGNDRLIGGSGADSISGGAGIDTVRGGAGNDSVGGGLDDDSVAGGAGDDVIFWTNNRGFDTLDAGPGDDLATVSPITADMTVTTVAGSAGAEVIIDTPDDDAILRNFETVEMVANVPSAGDITVTVGDLSATEMADARVIFRDFTDETFFDGQASGNPLTFSQQHSSTVRSDELDIFFAGSSDQDVLSISEFENGVFPLDSTWSFTGSMGELRAADGLSGNVIRTRNIEIVEMSMQAGNAAIDIDVSASSAFAGRFEISARDGDDSLHVDDGVINEIDVSGGAGADSLKTGFADDIVRGGTGADVLAGGFGGDTLLGGAGADTLAGDAGGDVLRGGGGRDAADYSDAAGGIFVNLAAGNGPEGDTLVSIEDAIGSSGFDTLRGDAGANRLSGGVGDDTLRGQGGGDSLFGQDGGDDLRGNGGADEVRGGNGFDRLSGNQGADTLAGGGGSDTLAGGKGADTLLGGNGVDRLSGGAAGDVLRGRAGSDTLDGGAGNDRLLGGGDGDVFAFAPGGGRDTIADFEDGSDLIDLSAFGFASAGEARQQATNQAGDVLFDFGGGDTLLVENITRAQLTGADFIL